MRTACLAAAIAVSVAVAAAMQAPVAPRLDGEAPPPASTLSLWYRAPASDHPLLPADAPRETRQPATAEWVRALPVGNGRLGAMVFGGIVHERLQLNEDTLWAGRPYDPVNPEAKDALPEVRRLLDVVRAHIVIGNTQQIERLPAETIVRPYRVVQILATHNRAVRPNDKDLAFVGISIRSSRRLQIITRMFVRDVKE